MSNTQPNRILQISASCLVMAGFIGFAPLVSADEAVEPTAQLMGTDVDALRAEILAEVREDLGERLPMEIAMATDPTAKAETLQADAR